MTASIVSMAMTPLECELLLGNYDIPILRPMGQKFLPVVDQFAYICRSFKLLYVHTDLFEDAHAVHYSYVSAFGSSPVIAKPVTREKALWAMEAMTCFKDAMVPATHCPMWAVQGLARCVGVYQKTFNDALAACNTGVMEQLGASHEEWVRTITEEWDQRVMTHCGGDKSLLSSANPEVCVTVLCRGDLSE